MRGMSKAKERDMMLVVRRIREEVLESLHLVNKMSFEAMHGYGDKANADLRIAHGQAQAYNQLLRFLAMEFDMECEC
jgi:hypothetical protein